MSDNAISSALSSLSRSKKEFDLIAHNVANANSNDYSRLKINTSPKIHASHLGGVEISSITTDIDQTLQTQYLSRIAQDSFNEVIKEFYEQIVIQFGDPTSESNLESKLSKVFNIMNDLTTDPSSAGIQKLTVTSINDLADTFNELSNNFQDLRYQADNKISNAVEQINDLLSEAHVITTTLYSIQENSIQKSNAQEKLRLTLEKLSEYFELYQYIDDKGHYKIYTKEGDSLVGDIQYFLKYIPQSGVENFINSAQINPILLSAHDSVGNDININLELVPGGISESIKNKYHKGKLSALLNARDAILPSILNQLDSLAKNIKDNINQIHNSGTSFIPPNTLNGTNLMTLDQILGFSGKARIAIVDNDGMGIDNISALNIDFSNLDTGQGNGKANLNGIIQEINYHFNQKLSTDKSVSLGSINDIRLRSSSYNFDANPINFAVELENYSQTDANFKILSTSAVDSLGNAVNLNFDSNTFTSQSQTTSVTNPSILSLNLLPTQVNNPITITMNVNVSDTTGSHTSTLSYVIGNKLPDSINGHLNQRYAIAYKSNPLDEAIIKNPVLTSPVMSAQLVNQDNGLITIEETLGVLQLTTTNESYRIAIDNLSSIQQGDINNNIIGSGYNFSYYTGLNDLLVRGDNPVNWNNVKNTSLFLKVRDDISTNAGYFAQGILQETVDYSQPNNKTYKFNTSQSNIDNLQRMQLVADQNIYYASVGGLPASQTTFSKYSASIIGLFSSLYSRAELSYEESSLIKSALGDKLQNIRGVDVNQEMANMIIFQQSFAASAKIVQAIREMNETLLSIL